MKVVPTALGGVFRIEIEPRIDERGLFARTWCVEEARAAGLVPTFAQQSVSFNRRAGTLRGMHYQAAPFAETKVVRCTRGAAWDVALDLRPDSATFRQWTAVELTADNHVALYIPPGFAHGFMTLADETELAYQITPAYAPEAARGVRWNDPAFGIAWPVANPIMADRDRSWADFGA